MSAARRRSRIARTTVALGAAGTMVLAPIGPALVPALAQEAAAAALDPVTIRTGVNKDFTRVEFAGVVGSRARVRREGQEVIVRIGSTAAPDVSRLRVNPPDGVEKVETRAARNATELVMTLAEGGDFRTGIDDGAVWLNLYAPGKVPAVAETAATISPNTIVPVSTESTADKTVLQFEWPSPVGAAVFRRGEAVWVVFDAAARLDMASARDTGPAGAPRWAVGPDYTVVRIPAAGSLALSARGEGSGWTVTIGGPPMSSTGVALSRDDTGEPSLVAQMAGATKAIWLTDPMVGDRFAAVTALAPGKGFGARKRTVDATLLPTAQGLAVETATDDLTIVPEGDLVTLSRPGGLTLSPPSVELSAAESTDGAPVKARYPALILSEWASTGQGTFQARYRELSDAAANEAIAASDDPRQPIEARLALTRFLVGSGLGYEAIGVVTALVTKSPGLQGEPELRGLRGAARASIGRLEEAAADFSAGTLSGDPSTRVWQGYLAANQGEWAEARQAFSAGAAVIDQFPPEWRARFGTAHAMAALETGDLAAARELLNYVFAQNAPAVDQLAARLVQAQLFERDGRSDTALAIYKAVARTPMDGIATPAKLGVIKLELAKGAMKPDAAAAELESLKWRWRGDTTELAVIRTLGGLYLSQGRYREALEALRGAGSRMATMPGGAELQADLANAFRAMFLDGAADGLQPVQALGLFYDFRELTPVGADGDEMVRRLARRLIDVDLLDPAAELLKHQVENRLEGVAKAQVATDLATVYLMDRQPEPALQALWSSRTTLLPSALTAERRGLEARALMELGRTDHALEVLGNDQSPAARDVRAEILWKKSDWTGAAALYESRLGERFRDTASPLTAEEESRLIRAGVGYSLARDSAALTRLSRNYMPFVERARSPASVRIALDGLDGMEGPAAAGDFAGLTANADTFTGWVNAMKTSLREKTAKAKTGGANAAAPAPARPQPAAAAAA